MKESREHCEELACLLGLTSVCSILSGTQSAPRRQKLRSIRAFFYRSFRIGSMLGFLWIAWMIPGALYAQEPDPLSVEDVEQLLGGLPESRILAIALEDCIDFAITEEIRLRLERAGASANFLNSLRSVCRREETRDPPPPPGEDEADIRPSRTGVFGSLSALLLLPTDDAETSSGLPIGVEAQGGWGLPEIGFRAGIGFWGALDSQETAPGRSEPRVDLWRFVGSADLVVAPSQPLYGFAGASTFSDGTIMARGGAGLRWQTSGGTSLTFEVRLSPRFLPYWVEPEEAVPVPIWSVSIGVGGALFPE